MSTGLSYRKLRRRLTGMLREIGVPQPWDITEFCAGIGRYRDRAIELLAHDMPEGGPDGMWIALGHVDVIVYDRNTSELHQEHIISHEVGHILLCHRGDDDSATVLPDLDPQVLRAMGVTSHPERSAHSDADSAGPPRLHREGYTSEQEQEAEVAASLIWQLAGRALVTPSREPDEHASDIDRLAAVMERTRRG